MYIGAIFSFQRYFFTLSVLGAVLGGFSTVSPVPLAELSVVGFVTVGVGEGGVVDWNADLPAFRLAKTFGISVF